MNESPRDLNENPSWCPVPWADISTANTGDYRVCVQAASHRETRGLLLDEDGRALSLSADPSDQARNAATLKDIRKCMLAGELHPICERCNYEDANGLESRRKLKRKNAEELFQKTLRLTEADGGIKSSAFPVHDLDLRFGNLCNFSCRSCYPGESSGWFEEWYTHIAPSFNLQGSRLFLSRNKAGKVFAPHKKLRWYENEAFIKNLENCEIKNIHISGGEPLLIKQHLQLLNHLISQGRAKDITLDYNTNLSVLPEGLIKIWSQFKGVRLGVSIDGHQPVNTYIRHPSKWATLENNLKQIDQLEFIDWWPTFTVMIYNVLYIPEFLTWKLENFPRFKTKLAKKILFATHMLHNPAYFRVSALPKDAKLQVAAKLRGFGLEALPRLLDERLEEQDLKPYILKSYSDIIEGIISFMNQSHEEHRIEPFWARTLLIDKSRGQDIKTSLPELWSLIEASPQLRETVKPTSTN